MNQKNIIKAVMRASKVTGIDVKDLVVGSGAASVLHGFRNDTSDADVSCSIFNYDMFRNTDRSDGYKEVEVSTKGLGEVTITELPLKVDLHRGLPADISTTEIMGITVYSLESLLNQKEQLNRPKDQLEIHLIRHALTGNKLPLRQRVGLIIFNDSREVLVGTNETPDGNYYVMPGGGVDEGQSYEVAAYREALEEVGFQVSNIEYSGVTHLIGKEALNEERAKIFSGAVNSIYFCKQGKKDLSLFNSEGDGLKFEFVKPKEAIKLIQTNDAAWVPFVVKLLEDF